MFPVDLTPQDHERSKVSTRVHLENGLAQGDNPECPKKEI